MQIPMANPTSTATLNNTHPFCNVGNVVDLFKPRVLPKNQTASPVHRSVSSTRHDRDDGEEGRGVAHPSNTSRGAANTVPSSSVAFCSCQVNTKNRPRTLLLPKHRETVEAIHLILSLVSDDRTVNKPTAVLPTSEEETGSKEGNVNRIRPERLDDPTRHGSGTVDIGPLSAKVGSSQENEAEHCQ